MFCYLIVLVNADLVIKHYALYTNNILILVILCALIKDAIKFNREYMKILIFMYSVVFIFVST